MILMMSAGLSNEDIAVQVEVSLSTVKFHSSNIFKKLKVKNRQQAIIRAKEIGYI